MTTTHDAVAGVAGMLFGSAPEGDPEEGPNGSEGSPEPVLEAAPVAPEAPAPDLEVEIPEDIEALLDEPEFDDEVEEINLEEFQDPEELAREVNRLRKQNLYLERQAQAKVIKEAKAEASKYFPLADVDALEGTSRRAILRQAKAQHDALKPRVEAILAAERSRLTGEQVAAGAAAQGRQAQAAAWGPPVVGVGGPPPATTQDEVMGRAIKAGKGGNIAAAVRTLLDADNAGEPVFR